MLFFFIFLWIMKRLLTLTLLLLSLLATGQYHISGVVKDSKTKQPLPFATLLPVNAPGDITDTEGIFNLSSKQPFTAISVSYVGYRSRKITISPSDNFITVFLEPQNQQLKEVIVVAKENPALAIIRKVIENKEKNDIEKALASFEYKAYNKLIVTANPDSISGKVDSVFVVKDNKKSFLKLDSTNYEFKKEIDKHHLYISEKVSDIRFKKGKNKKEVILASRMAGFKNPVYEILGLNIENFSFYEETYSLLGHNYINPLAGNALKNYSYKILDTVHTSGIPAYMIYFKAKKIKETAGLEGVLYINSQSYALEKGIAELKGILNVKAVQNFKYLPDHNIWFPYETTLTIQKGYSKENIDLFGLKVQISDRPQNDTIVNTKRNDPSDVSYMRSNTSNFDISINEPVKVLNSAAVIEVDENAANRDENFWNKYRTDSITQRGIAAYKTIDSIFEKEKVEEKLNMARSVIKGYYPLHYFDLSLSQLVNFNNYEGFRLGLGGVTNANFSRLFRMEGYTAYGIKDQAFKYHFSSFIRLDRQNNTWIGAGYTNDLREAALLNFVFEDTSFSLINPRNLNIAQFINYKLFDISLEHDIFPNLEAKLKLEHGNYNPQFNYQFTGPGTDYHSYDLSTATFGLQWTPFSKYMNTPRGKSTVKKGYPNITAQLTKSFDNLLKGDLDFIQFNFKVYHVIKAFNKSSTSFLIQGGVTTGDIPISHLYNAYPNYTFRNPWLKRVNFSGTNAFETMGFNEFLSDRYISLQVRHNFDRFQLGNKFKPALSLVTRFAIGDIKNPERQGEIAFRKMNKGYYESGFVLNYLFKGFGLASFYRYGSYSNPKFTDNLAVKLTYVLSLGF